MRHLTILLCLLLSFQVTARAEQQQSKTKPSGFKVVTVVRGLNYPWSLAFLPDNSFLVTERRGRMLLFKNDGVTRVVRGLPRIVAKSQGGLLDVIPDPDFSTNRTIYFSYVAGGFGGTGTEVARAVLDGTTLKNMKVIFRAEPKTGKPKHFGSRLLIAPDGTLFITLGDRGNKDWNPASGKKHVAQDPSNHLGTIVRINKDGSVPKDNPFVGRKGYRPEIYTYGNRNVQGIARHPETGAIWFHEHGPKGGDELGILEAGANYGWPTVTYGIDYNGDIISYKTSAPGFTSPITQWTPCIAPSGMIIYDGSAFPEWKNNIFIGALVQRHLRRVILEGNRVVGEESLLKSLRERIRDVRTGPDGYIYVLTDSQSGRVLRLEPRSNP